MLTNAAQTLRFKGWQIVGLMLLPRAGGTGTYILGSTLFVIPLEQTLGMQRSVTSLLFALGSMVASLAAPVSGAIMDRYGPRWVLLASVLVSAGGYLLFAASVNVAMVFIVVVGVISPVILNVAFNASSAFVNNWFHRYKATAMSLLQVGSGLGAIIIIPSLAFAIDTWHWRAGAIAAAAFLVALGVPAALLSRNTPEEVGMLPDGERSVEGSVSVVVTEPTAREAFRTPTFWFLVMAGAAFGGAQAATQIHFVPIMVWKGLDEVRGALILTSMAFISTPAILAMGALADRMGRLTVAVGACLMVAVGFVLLNFSGPEWTIWGAALIAAPQFGLYPLLWAALGQAFGRKAFSTIRGTAMAFQAGTTLGMPILAGLLYDATSNYHTILWVVVGLWLFAAAALFLNPRKSYVRVEPAAS